MKTRILTLLRALTVLAALGFSSLLNAQTVTLVSTGGYSTNSIVLATGDTATIVSQFCGTNTSPITLASAVVIGGVEFNPPTTGYTVAGPATIYARSGGNGTSPAFVTVSITRANSTPTSAPLNTVVIPSDATGSYNVVLESSTDLITWVAANPATYSGITTNRFFRVRVIKQ